MNHREPSTVSISEIPRECEKLMTYMNEAHLAKNQELKDFFFGGADRVFENIKAMVNLHVDLTKSSDGELASLKESLAIQHGKVAERGLEILSLQNKIFKVDDPEPDFAVEALGKRIHSAIRLIAESIYFDDSSKHLGALWNILGALDPEAKKALEKSSKDFYFYMKEKE